MSVFLNLSALALHGAVRVAVTTLDAPAGEAIVDAVSKFLTRHLTDHTRTVTDALAKANDRAWRALECALAGDSLWQRGKDLVTLTSPDDKKARAFLAAAAVAQLDPAFRTACLKELRRARKAKLLDAGPNDVRELPQRASAFARFANTAALPTAEWQAIEHIADQFPAQDYPNLRRLLKLRPDDGPPFLAVAAQEFLRLEVQDNDPLFRALSFDVLDRLQHARDRDFAALHAFVAKNGEVLERLLDLVELSTQTHAAVLDLRDEQRRQGAEARGLYDEVIRIHARLDLLTTKVRPGDSLSIRTDHERQVVRSLLVRFRALPPERQQEAPALLNGLGMLEVAAGAYAEAGQIFREVAGAVAHDATAQAEAHHNAYRAALEQQDWPSALSSLGRCVELKPEFAPFPFDRYEPAAVLGAGGFGTAFLCRHRRLNARVVVKSLNTSELERDVDELFREAQVLEELNHPGIIRVRDADYAGPGKVHPYLVMDWFDGVDLERYVRQHGPLGVDVGMDFARQLAEAVAAAHARGLLHRDLKPSNVLVQIDGTSVRIKLIDFGLALRSDALRGAATASGKSLVGSSAIGSLDYAAPEQMGRLPGVTVGPYSDVYGWARTCCWALCRTPNPRPRDFRALPPVPTELLEDCIAEQPAERPADFAAVLARLRVDHIVRAGMHSSGDAPNEEAERQQREARARERQPKPGDVITNSIGMKLAYIPPGTFQMGSPKDEEGHQDDETPHKVTLTKGFFLGVYPVTQAQWRAVMGTNPSYFKGDDLPVEQVTWRDCQEFIQRLRDREGKPYRLPTEAEWEYACRAGTTGPYAGTGSLDDMGWHHGNSGRKTRPVGRKRPNAWGLYDMHGNVWEWCADAYADYPHGHTTDPTGPSALPQDAVRVIRGGSLNVNSAGCRAAFRGEPDGPYNVVGLRVALNTFWRIGEESGN